MKRQKPLIDDRVYTVTAINGYRRGNLTRIEAFQHATNLDHQMQVAGWRGKARIYYRDGSEVQRDDP